jgi:class 3 adenylate cyclase
LGVATTHDARLDTIVEGLENTGWAAELCDADWQLVWVSSQTRALIAQYDENELGIGMHMLESRQLPGWIRLVDEDSQRAWIAQNVPQMLADDPDSAERLLEMVPPGLRDAVSEARPAAMPMWTALTQTTGVAEAVDKVRYFGVRIREASGDPLATVYIYGADLPATLLALVAQGDRAMFERMARLADPGRHEAAIVFADIQGSGELSRHLSSAAYFRLVQDLFTRLDQVVIDANGIVGKHAGDGLSAFFLADDCGSAADAAAAALDAARELAATARATAAEAEGPVRDLRLNVGVHWGGALYMGQVVTGGRLEVTALGDEVNECARIQDSARDGTVLASKALIERVDPDRARQAGVIADEVSYSTVGELPGASEKAVRDAGSIPVAQVPLPG